MGYKKKMVVKVRNHHIDSYGHVNNAQYLVYLEDARTDFFEELGYGLQVLDARKIQVFLTEVTLKFKSPTTVNDWLEIYGWFIELTNRKATWQHEIYHQESGRLVLTGTATGMFLQNGKLGAIPEDIRKAMMELYIPNH
jgi:YbgC/YbaW family acyl-CoA thioester hydrolase